MHYINNLPVILAAFSAIVVGIYGYLNHFSNTATYKYMCFFLIVFFLIGILIKKTVLDIQEETAARNEKTPISGELLYAEKEMASRNGAETAGEEDGHPVIDGKTGAAVVKTMLAQPEDTAGDDYEGAEQGDAEEAEMQEGEFTDFSETDSGEPVMGEEEYEADKADSGSGVDWERANGSGADGGINRASDQG